MSQDKATEAWKQFDEIKDQLAPEEREKYLKDLLKYGSKLEPTMSEKIFDEVKMLTQYSLSALDKMDAPRRSAIKAGLEGENPFTAAKETVMGERQAPTDTQVGEAMGFSDEGGLETPLGRISPADAAGAVTAIATDPLAVGGAAVKKASKLFTKKALPSATRQRLKTASQKMAAKDLVKNVSTKTPFSEVDVDELGRILIDEDIADFTSKPVELNEVITGGVKDIPIERFDDPEAAYEIFIGQKAEQGRIKEILNENEFLVNAVSNAPNTPMVSDIYLRDTLEETLTDIFQSKKSGVPKPANVTKTVESVVDRVLKPSTTRVKKKKPFEKIFDPMANVIDKKAGATKVDMPTEVIPAKNNTLKDLWEIRKNLATDMSSAEWAKSTSDSQVLLKRAQKEYYRLLNEIITEFASNVNVNIAGESVNAGERYLRNNSRMSGLIKVAEATKGSKVKEYAADSMPARVFGGVVGAGISSAAGINPLVGVALGGFGPSMGRKMYQSMAPRGRKYVESLSDVTQGDIMSKAGTAMMGTAVAKPPLRMMTQDEQNRSPQSIVPPDRQDPIDVAEALSEVGFPNDTKTFLETYDINMVKMAQQAPEYFEAFEGARNTPELLGQMLMDLKRKRPELFQPQKYDSIDGKLTPEAKAEWHRDATFDLKNGTGANSIDFALAMERITKGEPLV